jgi:hypothetical protein
MALEKIICEIKHKLNDNAKKILTDLSFESERILGIIN